jgi:uncharacterized protein (TIGR02453 family)
VSGFPRQTLDFLAGLAFNNEKAWFDAHREDYQRYYVEPSRAFVNDMGARLRKLSPRVQFEPKVGGSMMRVNRDTRFSKDKTPYKTSLSLWFWEGKDRNWQGSGFWFSLDPRRVAVGVGLYMMEPELMARFRKRVANDQTGRALEKLGIEVHGEKYKRVPKPYPADHPRAELLKLQGCYAYVEEKPPRELGSPKFVEWCASRWKRMLPLHRWLLPLGR